MRLRFDGSIFAKMIRYLRRFERKKFVKYKTNTIIVLQPTETTSEGMTIYG